MKDDHTECPAGLGPAGKKFWKAVNAIYVIPDGDRQEKLAIACRSLDDEAVAAEVIARDGRYIAGRFGCKEHPAGKVLRDSRIVFLRALRELGLDVEGAAAGGRIRVRCKKKRMLQSALGFRLRGFLLRRLEIRLESLLTK